jgi:hypothetical protein
MPSSDKLRRLREQPQLSCSGRICIPEHLQPSPQNTLAAAISGDSSADCVPTLPLKMCSGPSGLFLTRKIELLEVGFAAPVQHEFGYGPGNGRVIAECQGLVDCVAVLAIVLPKAQPITVTLSSIIATLHNALHLQDGTQSFYRVEEAGRYHGVRSVRRTHLLLIHWRVPAPVGIRVTDGMQRNHATGNTSSGSGCCCLRCRNRDGVHDCSVRFGQSHDSVFNSGETRQFLLDHLAGWAGQIAAVIRVSFHLLGDAGLFAI